MKSHTDIESPPAGSPVAPETLWNIVTVAGFLQAAGIPSSEPTIRRKVAAGKFPAPIRFGGRCSRWKSGAVQGWLTAQMADPIVAE